MARFNDLKHRGMILIILNPFSGHGNTILKAIFLQGF